jgi:hypothetical protein
MAGCGMVSSISGHGSILWVLVNMVMNLQVPYNVGKYLDQHNYDLL